MREISFNGCKLRLCGLNQNHNKMKKEYFEEKQFPVGAGEEFVEKRKELSLPAVEIKNKVLWVNPAFKEAPFKLEKGKQTKLGMFFTPPRPADKQQKETFKLSIMPEEGAGRSGLIGSVIFRDQEGRLYRDVDIKGIGAFEKRWNDSYAVTEIQQHDYHDSNEALGLMDYGHALRDQEYSEKFLKAGIRTHRVLAIIKPEEIVDQQGMKIDIKQIKKQKYDKHDAALLHNPVIPKKLDPVILVRAFGTKERINYVLGHNIPKERIYYAIEDARKMVAQELNRDPKTFSLMDYLFWFAKELGKQVAKIRKLKLHHGYLTNHNISLDCRIVDLDSVTTIRETTADEKKRNIPTTEKKLFNHDFNMALASLSDLLNTILFISPFELGKISYSELKKIYADAYAGELRTTKTKKY